MSNKSLDAEQIAAGFSIGGFAAPKFEGYWRIGGSYGLRFGVERRPRWLTRKLCNWLFEFEWEEA